MYCTFLLKNSNFNFLFYYYYYYYYYYYFIFEVLGLVNISGHWRMMNDDDNDDQMIFGDLGGLKLPDICLTGEEKSRKNSPRKLVQTGTEPLSRCVTGAHATVWATMVDVSLILHCVYLEVFTCQAIENTEKK